MIKMNDMKQIQSNANNNNRIATPKQTKQHIYFGAWHKLSYNTIIIILEIDIIKIIVG